MLSLVGRIVAAIRFTFCRGLRPAKDRGILNKSDMLSALLAVLAVLMMEYVRAIFMSLGSEPMP